MKDTGNTRGHREHHYDSLNKKGDIFYIDICIWISRLQMVGNCNFAWDKETMSVLFTMVCMHATHHGLETRRTRAGGELGGVSRMS